MGTIRGAVGAAAAFALPALLAGCGTTLEVDEAVRGHSAPGGIAVNRRQTYAITVALEPGNPLESLPKIATDPKAAPGRLVGVDQTQIQVLDIFRMPFASGTLTVKLNDDQTLGEVGITSKPGTINAVSAADAVVDAYNKLSADEE